MCESISITFSIEEGSIRTEVTRFSTARTTPCAVWMPTEVEPSCAAVSGPARESKSMLEP